MAPLTSFSHVCTWVFSSGRFWSIFLGGLVVFCWSYYNVLCTLTPVFDNAFILAACVLINTGVLAPVFIKARRHFSAAFSASSKGGGGGGGKSDDDIFSSSFAGGEYSSLGADSYSSSSSSSSSSSPSPGGFSFRRCFSLVMFGGIDAILIVLMSYAFQHVPIGDASCLFALRVVWTPIFEAVWRRRCLPKGQVGVAVLSIAGAILITQPAVIFGKPLATPLDAMVAARRSLAYFCAVLAGMLAGMSYIFLAICPEVHWVVWQSMIVPLGWIIAPINYLIVNGISIPKSFGAADIIKLFLIALFDLLGRFCRTLAVQQDVADAASLVALVSVLEIPFTYFWGWLFASQNLHTINLIGAVIVVASVVLLSVPCLWEEERRDDEKTALVGDGGVSEEEGGPAGGDGSYDDDDDDVVVASGAGDDDVNGKKSGSEEEAKQTDGAGLKTRSD